MSKTLEKLLTEVPELKELYAVTRVGLDGTSVSRLLIPPFERGQAVWGGFTSEFEFSPDKKTFVGTFELPKMEAPMVDGEIALEGIRGRVDVVEALPGLYVGTSEVGLETMKMVGPGKKLQVTDFFVRYDSGCDGNLFHFDQIVKFAGLTMDGEEYGPGGCEIEGKNLDGEALGRFQNQLQEVYRGNNLSPDQAAAQITPLYGQLFVKLLDGNPELSIRRLYFATPKGTFDGNFLVKLNDHEGVTIAQPIALLQYLEAKADVSVHERLIHSMAAANIKDKLTDARNLGQIPDFSDTEISGLADQQADNQIQALLAQGLIVREGESIKANATFNQGKLVVNGNPLSIF